MKARALREAVCQANRELAARGLAPFTWGNASAIDRASGVVVIKPSGVAYPALRPEDMVLVELESGRLLEEGLSPSTDTPTHLELYRAFPQIGGVVHTHSPYATAWAQAGKDLPCYGTTHADYFYGPVPCVSALSEAELVAGYERQTGIAIGRTFAERRIQPLEVPAALLHGHAPFAWGKTVEDAVLHAAVLEEVARLAWHTLLLAPSLPPLPEALMNKHFLRKHGPGAYYGQSPKEETP